MSAKASDELSDRINDDYLKTLLKAQKKAQKNVEKAPTKENLEALKFAKEVVDGHIKSTKEPFFKDRMDALRHLQAQGYKIKKTKIYDDSPPKGKLLKIQKDGTVLESSLRQYIIDSKLFKPEEQDQRAKQIQMDLEKKEVELDKAREQLAELQLKRSVAEGEYILQSDLGLELASRATVLYSGLLNMFHLEMAEFVVILEGDSKKIPIVLEKIKEKIDSQFNEFATMKSFHILFED
ncbi:MAG: hypothetical protein PVI90_02475 [Desulfobacteraceae bacterium]|jgi:hypothetical protein